MRRTAAAGFRTMLRNTLFAIKKMPLSITASSKPAAEKVTARGRRTARIERTIVSERTGRGAVPVSPTRIAQTGRIAAVANRKRPARKLASPSRKTAARGRKPSGRTVNSRKINSRTIGASRATGGRASTLRRGRPRKTFRRRPGVWRGSVKIRYNRGYDSGFNAGFQTGYAKGLEDGHELAYKEL